MFGPGFSDIFRHDINKTNKSSSKTLIMEQTQSHKFEGKKKLFCQVKTKKSFHLSLKKKKLLLVKFGSVSFIYMDFFKLKILSANILDVLN